MIKHKQKIIIFIVIFLVSINIPILTYSSEFMFYNMTASNGLSQTSVSTIYQDSSGYIWIGTKNGLNKYNGFDLEIYNKGFSEKRNIVDGYITCLNEDLSKNLWVGTNDGLSKINLDTNKITNYTINTSSLLSSKIRDIKINNNGDIIIATSNGLYRYDKFADDFISLIHEDFKPSSSNILSIEIYNNAEIYIISPNCLFKYDMTNDKYTIIDNELIDTIAKNNTFTTFSLHKDSIYLGTLSDGLYVYNIKTGQVDKEYKLYTDGNSGPSNTVNSIHIDETGIYIGTKKGLYIDERDGLQKQFTHSFYDRYSLIDDNVSYIMKDSSGLLWIGTFSGISTVDRNLGITYYNDFFVNPSINNNNIVIGTYEDIDKKLWLGVYNNGISIWDKKNNTVTQLNTQTINKLNSDTIWDIKGTEKYIFATSSVGLNIINRETLEVKHILDNIYCHTLYVDGDYLWVGTLDGFNIIDLNDFSIKNMNKLFAKNNISVKLGGAIFKDSRGIYWLGSSTKDGLIRFDHKNNSLKLFKYNEFENSISDNSILSINEDNKGNLWFGTESGLNKYNSDTEEFILYSIEDGLSNNTIYSVKPFNNDIWISTNSGINCLQFEDNQLINIRKYLKGVEFSSNSFFETSNGEFILGGIDGLYKINPAAVESSLYSPMLQFDSFILNGTKVNDFNNTSIKYKDNFISIKLFTTAYSSIQNINFYYRINNDKWILMDSNEVTFSNLADNKYTIDFIAKNSNGNNSEIKSISFNVDPPFWRSKIAIFIYFLLFCIIAIYLYLKIAYMSNAIILRNKQLAKEMLEKNQLLTKNIELEKRKNNYLINMSHELRTPLNVIGATQQLITRLNNNGSISSEDLSKYMEISDNNQKRLLKIINDLIDSTKMNEGMYKLLVEEKDIIYVIEEAALSLKSLAEEKEINLIIDTNVEECIMKFDEDAIERCIINIVGNAIKFTNPGGEILVNIMDFYSILKIEISDTGSGIPAEKIDTIFDRFDQAVNSKREVSMGSGLGLTITKGLIELHTGNVFVKSKLGEGTTFTIILPKTIEETNEV